MKLPNFFILVIAIISVGLSSGCSKETRIEKNLWNKGGEWNIDTYTEVLTSNYPSGGFNRTKLNYGTMLFNEDGTGVATFTDNGATDVNSFTYSITASQLALNLNGGIENKYDMNWEKNSLEMTFYETHMVDTLFYTYTETFQLRKK